MAVPRDARAGGTGNPGGGGVTQGGCGCVVAAGPETARSFSGRSLAAGFALAGLAMVRRRARKGAAGNVGK